MQREETSKLAGIGSNARNFMNPFTRSFEVSSIPVQRRELSDKIRRCFYSTVIVNLLYRSKEAAILTRLMSTQ